MTKIMNYILLTFSLFLFFNNYNSERLTPDTLTQDQKTEQEIEKEKYEKMEAQLKKDTIEIFFKRINNWIKTYHQNFDISDQPDFQMIFSRSLNEVNERYEENKTSFTQEFRQAFESAFDILMDLKVFSPCLDSKTRDELINQLQDTIDKRSFFKESKSIRLI